MKIFIILAFTITIVLSVYTSTHIKEMGYKINGDNQPIKPVLKAISTSCNNVPLGQAPYNWQGISVFI
jgi:hypothetical protein